MNLVLEPPSKFQLVKAKRKQFQKIILYVFKKKKNKKAKMNEQKITIIEKKSIVIIFL